ncbi:MAG: CvpA family protein [Gammaproteobacteria bacterium]|jgi:membrane protein required for colicin V production
MINIAQFNWFDYLLTILLLISVVAGFRQGFVKGLVAVIIWLAALLVSLLFVDNIAVYVVKVIPSVSWSYFISFIFLVLVILILGSILYYAIRWVGRFGDNIIGGLFGAIFGFIKGMLIIAVFVAAFSAINFYQYQWFRYSQLVHFSQNIISNIQLHIPKVTKKIRKKVH